MGTKQIWKMDLVRGGDKRLRDQLMGAYIIPCCNRRVIRQGLHTEFRGRLERTSDVFQVSGIHWQCTGSKQQLRRIRKFDGRES